MARQHVSMQETIASIDSVAENTNYPIVSRLIFWCELLLATSSMIIINFR